MRKLLIVFSGFIILSVSAIVSLGQNKPLNSKTSIKETPLRQVAGKPDSITISAVGDIMLGSTSINETFLPPDDGKNLLKEVAPVLSQADITFGNLEGPMLEGGTSEKCPPQPQPQPQPAPSPTPKLAGSTKTLPTAAETEKLKINCFAFRVPPRYGKYLKDAGFDVLSLANNHAGDFGSYGRASTRQVLKELAIKHSGSSKTDFAYFKVKGKRIVFVSFAHNNISLNVNNLSAARSVVSRLRKKADIIVVSFHGGAEGLDNQHVPNETEIYFGEPRGNLRAFTHTVIDAGADLVLGHGPHVLRGMEIYKDRLIIYSMGNFATYGMFSLKGAQGLNGIFEINLGGDGKFIGGKVYAGKQTGRGGPTFDESGKAISILRRLSAEDFGASAAKISDDGTISKE